MRSNGIDFPWGNVLGGIRLKVSSLNEISRRIGRHTFITFIQ
jgi:hypothetical protein